ncbi:MAG: hypothetical protein V4584_02280 [Verrucomicrobiota bacterium]
MISIAIASILGFVVGVRWTSQRKERVFDLTNKFVLSAEVSTQLDMHTLLGESMLRSDSSSQESAMRLLGTQIQREIERIVEDQVGVGQLTDQEKIDRAKRVKDGLLARAKLLPQHIPDAERGAPPNP